MLMVFQQRHAFWWKEMLIYFGTKTDINWVPSITANGKTIVRVNSFKCLWVVISSDLSWHAHVSYMLQKVSKRIFCISNWLVLYLWVRYYTGLYLIYPLCFWICLSHVAPWFNKIKRNWTSLETLFDNNLPKTRIHWGASYIWTCIWISTRYLFVTNKLSYLLTVLASLMCFLVHILTAIWSMYFYVFVCV